MNSKAEKGKRENSSIFFKLWESSQVICEKHTLSVKKKVGVKKSRQKNWSVKKLVTFYRLIFYFSHFLPTFFLPGLKKKKKRF